MLIRFLLVFISLCVILSLGMSFFGIELGEANYWDYHGFILLFFLSFFPRLALLLSSIPFGGFFWWLGFFICPHYLVAALATVNYWHSNPLLVTFAWLFALGGETSEKYYIHRKVREFSTIDVEHRVVS